MAWERGAWEKNTSRGAPYSNTSQEGIVNNSSSSRTPTRVSGGLSFCPKCGSMMMGKNGIFRCSQCGYSKEDVNSPSYISRQDRLRKQERERKRYEEKQQETKRQMNEILRLMRQGKTRSQAASIAGIPLSRINHWYREGSIGTNQNTSHFYRELKYIEEDGERRKRAEINKMYQQERERNARRERERQERLRKQQREQSIQKLMNTIVSQMESGKTRARAGAYAGVKVSTINEWFNKGRRREGKIYTDFYNKVNTIETRQKKEIRSKSSNYIKCPKCGKFYNSSKTDCPNCKSSIKKSPTYASKKNKGIDKEKQLDKFVSLMRSGLSRHEAAQKMNLSVITVNNWYNKGSRGDATYVKFYNNVKSIEGTRKKYNPTSIPKTSSSDKVKCHKCGKSYNKSLNKDCPYCRKSKALSEIKYCQNCGKKIDKNDSIYCTNCGASIKTGRKKYSGKTTSRPTTSNDSSFDWAFCCILIFIIFAIIAFLALV